MKLKLIDVTSFKQMTSSSMVSPNIQLPQNLNVNLYKLYKVEGAALSVFFIYIRVVFSQTDLRSILIFGMPSKIQKYQERYGTTWGGRGGERESFSSLFLERV